MCIGVPMRVVSAQPGMASALCVPWPVAREADSMAEVTATAVDVRLVGEVEVGQWLLVFLGAARECLTAERAGQVGQALAALQQLQNGQSPDVTDLFADLDREPQLPEHLRTQSEPPDTPLASATPDVTLYSQKVPSDA